MRNPPSRFPNCLWQAENRKAATLAPRAPERFRSEDRNLSRAFNQEDSNRCRHPAGSNWVRFAEPNATDKLASIRKIGIKPKTFVFMRVHSWLTL
jgi:hypothetical protein